MVERILFIVNYSSATGRSEAEIDRLHGILREALGPRTDLRVEAVEGHRQAWAQTRAFVAAADASALVIAGGGGGTLRAVIEGICADSEAGDLPGQERVRVAALRMGSGNVLARQFGVARDPEAGLKGIVMNLLADRVAPCCVMRYEVDGKNTAVKICHAATLAGFGAFGRVPRDLERWHSRLPSLHKLSAWLLGVERLTRMEYFFTLLVRSAWYALRPKAVQTLEIRTGEHAESMRVVAGAVVNFAFDALPFAPGVRAEDAALSLILFPYQGRCASLLLALSPCHLARKALQIRIADADLVELCLAHRDAADFFLDEDPMVFHDRIRIQIAGTLAFVPGSDYRWP